jgi:CDP-4-dehydro-6-deoxyglucose reductase, E3
MIAVAERDARLVRIVEHAPDTRSLFLRLPPGERLECRPGQFVSCLLPIGDRPPLIRPYSLASDPEDEELELCLNLVPGGPGSLHLFQLAPGAVVRLTGPWGTFVLDRAPDAETVFIADGTGIAPIRPMIHRALQTATHPIRLLHGSEGTPLYARELRALAGSHRAFAVEHVASARLQDEVVRRWIDADDDRRRHFFVCGVGDIVRTLRDLLRRAGYERRAVQYEKW